MAKVRVNKDLCIGCGLCVSMAPASFEFDDDGKAKAIVEEATDEANDAAGNCPAQAIEVE